MNKEFAEIVDYRGQGFKPLVTFGNWRVAVLRYLEKLEIHNISEMERHAKTDEVFILVEGTGELIIGGNSEKPAQVLKYQMKIGELINVKKNTWHTLSLSKDAHVIIVENDDTNIENSEVMPIDAIMREELRKAT